MSQSTRRQSIGLVTRRRLLQVGAIGALCDLPSLLWASSPSGNGTTSSDPEKSCIFIFQQGGLSQLDSWDLKPDAPDSIRGPYRPIATSVTGFRVGELMPRLARLAHRYCVIRSMRHSEHVHDTAIGMSLTGKSRPPANWPYYGSVLSKLRPSRPGMQSFVCLIPVVGDQRTYHSPGFLGSAHTPLVVGTIADNPATPGFRMTAFDPPEGSTIERSGERRRLLQALESAALSRTPPSPPAAVVHGGAHASAQLDQFRQRAFDLTTSSAARRAFDLDRESPRVRDRYGRHPLGQNLLLARRLIEAGVRLVRVNAFTGLTPGAPPTFPQVWDMHGGSFGSIFGTGAWGLGYALPRADQAVAALRDDRVRTANRVARWRCRAGAAPVPRGSVSGAQGWEAAGVGEAVAGVVPAGAALGSAACQRSGSSSSRRSVGSDGKRVSTSFK